LICQCHENEFLSGSLKLFASGDRNVGFRPTAWRLAEEQLNAAKVPQNVREEYFHQFNEYLNSIGK